MNTTVQFTQVWHEHDGNSHSPIWEPALVRLGDGPMYIWPDPVLAEWSEVIAYTTDIFDGVFPEPEDGPWRDGSAFWGYSAEQGWNEMLAVYGGHFFALCSSPTIRCYDPIKWQLGKPDHIPDAGERVEPTRGAGCDNTPEWLGKALNDGSL